MKKEFLGVGLLAIGSSLAAQGPTGYWFTGSRNEVAPTIARYDSGSVFSFDSAGGYDSVIAVHGDVRTAASGASQYAYSSRDPDFGGLYNFDGTFSGTKFDALKYDPDFNVRAFDGTTDGSHNYFMNVGFQGGVWRTARDWSDAELLFALGSAGDHMGITYDPDHDSLWVSGGVGSNLIEEYDMEGNRLSWFLSSAGTNFSCLAMDYTDGTLWMSPAEHPGMFVNYDRSGKILGSFDNQFTSVMNFTAGEFNLGTVPEPTTLLVFGLTAVLLKRKRH